MPTKNSFDPRGGICELCEQWRSLRDGLCHECEQAGRDAAMIVDENGEEWTFGGFRL